MARLQTQSIHRMRPMLEEAQQTMPKSVDNDVLESMNYVRKAGAGLAQSMRPMDFGKLEQQTKNVMAVMQHMDMRQRALNNQQKLAQSQHFSDAYGSVHAERRPLRYGDIQRQHDELRALDHPPQLAPHLQVLLEGCEQLVVLLLRLRQAAPP